MAQQQPVLVEAVQVAVLLDNLEQVGVLALVEPVLAVLLEITLLLQLQILEVEVAGHLRIKVLEAVLLE
jgi:hypothetical protein